MEQCHNYFGPLSRLTEHHFFGSSYGVNSCNKEQKRLALCVHALAAFWVPMR